MEQLHEEQLVSVEIDLDELKHNDQLNESFLRMFGSWVSLLVKGMMGVPIVDIKIKGSPAEVTAFAKAVGHEKKYIEAAQKHGLTDAATYKEKSKLTKAVSAFEKATGIKWPFK